MRDYVRNENGSKSKVQIEIRGEGLIERQFRNLGEAMRYLSKEGYTKSEIKKYVRFIHS